MKYFDTKKDSLEEAISKAMNSGNRPSAADLVAEGGKYLKYSDLLLQKGRLMAKNQSTAMIDKEIKKEMGKLGIKEKLDPVGKADGDIDNDGDKDSSDKYLAKRRKAISKAIAKDKNEELEKDDETSVKKVIKGLKKAVDAHSGQVKSLTKDIKDEVDNITEETVFVVRFEKEGMRFATPFYDMKNAKDGEKILKRSSGVSNISITKDLLKPGIKLSTQEGIIVKEENLEVSEVQEVDNSIMARTTRLISQTAIKEKLDPADVDVRATDLDRKAADKNIFIQLKRAQDMNGKTDVEFLDKKKQKVDIRVINKALDMFDKMKPNDKLKMQLAIGKSYRDLLKVVQRGKV